MMQEQINPLTELCARAQKVRDNTFSKEFVEEPLEWVLKAYEQGNRNIEFEEVVNVLYPSWTTEQVYGFLRDNMSARDRAAVEGALVHARFVMSKLKVTSTRAKELQEEFVKFFDEKVKSTARSLGYVVPEPIITNDDSRNLDLYFFALDIANALQQKRDKIYPTKDELKGNATGLLINRLFNKETKNVCETIP